MPLASVERHGEKSALRINGSVRAPRGGLNGVYVGETGFVTTIDEATDLTGEEGPAIKGDPGAPGSPGANGWSPITTGERDGVRSLIYVDYIGGTGTKPSPGYIGPAGSSGLVSKANAFNFNPARSMVYMGTTNPSGDYTVTLPEPMTAPFISPVLYPSTAPERHARLLSMTKNAGGKVTAFTVRVEQRTALTVLTLQVLSFGVTPVSAANVAVIVVDVSTT